MRLKKSWDEEKQFGSCGTVVRGEVDFFYTPVWVFLARGGLPNQYPGLSVHRRQIGSFIEIDSESLALGRTILREKRWRGR
jgi:hypothetical protein